MISGRVAKRVLSSNTQLMKMQVRTMYPQMSSNHIACVPRVRIPFLEKVACGVFIVACVLTTPAYIITHLDDYRKRE